MLIPSCLVLANRNYKVKVKHLNLTEIILVLGCRMTLRQKEIVDYHNAFETVLFEWTCFIFPKIPARNGKGYITVYDVPMFSMKQHSNLRKNNYSMIHVEHLMGSTHDGLDGMAWQTWRHDGRPYNSSQARSSVQPMKQIFWIKNKALKLLIVWYKCSNLALDR